jgi:Glycosyl transferase family 2
MKLAASLIVRNELGRYLEPCIDHLLEFCDLVVVLDDRSTDGTKEWLLARIAGGVQNLVMHSEPEVAFFSHEGQARQWLLECTLSWEPTHVLALDADELVADGRALRRFVEQEEHRDGANLNMREVWEADSDGLCIREDGGWRSHPVPALWRVPEQLDASWRIADRALACGREPMAVSSMIFANQNPVTDLLHFGWANEQERQARYDRYAEHDRGRFHASQHLDSIMWGCDRVQLRPLGWPAGLAAYKDAILERANAVHA